MKVKAVVIARGGSRRVPRKNVRTICGLPLVAWSVIQAVNSRHINEVYLSTDDDEIADIGEAFGATIIRRPDWPDADEVAANRPMLHAMETIDEGEDFCMVQLLPTSPQRLPDDLDRGVETWFECRGHVIGAVNKRETFVHRKISQTIGRSVLADKFYTYLTPTSGLINICSAYWYRWFVGNMDTDHDAVIDERMRDHPELMPEIDFYWVPTEYWQENEVDTPSEFAFTEAIFEHFVLQGQGPKVYYDYSGKAMPPVLSAGNWRQQ
jgi:CMP-N-acetylneuraminic acid synthetase